MPDSLERLAALIQLSVAPVFLLTGVGALLSVMTQRLARVIDRARVLNAVGYGMEGVDDFVLAEIRTLHRRMHLINRAIALCTYSALLVAAVIAVLFLGALLRFQLAPLVAAGFVGAMLLLIGGLVSFLGEVHVATRFMRMNADVVMVGRSK